MCPERGIEKGEWDMNIPIIHCCIYLVVTHNNNLWLRNKMAKIVNFMPRKLKQNCQSIKLKEPCILLCSKFTHKATVWKTVGTCNGGIIIWIVEWPCLQMSFNINLVEQRLTSHGRDLNVISEQNGCHDWHVGPYLLALMDNNIIVIKWWDHCMSFNERHLQKKFQIACPHGKFFLLFVVSMHECFPWSNTD